jgi:hypothetical protein
MRIAVLEYEQTPTCEPIHYVSKKLAQKLLSYRDRGKLIVSRVSEAILWIRANISFGKLKRRLVNPTHESKPRYAGNAPYIPVKLPRAEVEGVKYQPPAKDAGKAIERRFRLMQANQWMVRTGAEA